MKYEPTHFLSLNIVPKDAPPLTLAVNKVKRGPLRIALAHENLHQKAPTVVSSTEPHTYKNEFSIDKPLQQQ